MAISLQFYADSSLTQPLASSAINRLIGGDPVDLQVFLGANVAGRYFVPDVDSQIIVSIADADASSGFSATDIKLASTQAALDTAVAGAPLSVCGQINSGAVGAVPIWLRFSGNSPTPKTSSDLSLITNVLREYAQ